MLSTPPFAMQNASHSAALFRQALSSMLYRAGTISEADFAVSAQSTPNMTVLVSPGQAWVAGADVGDAPGMSWSPQGMYYAQNTASVTLSIATADPTYPRQDAVYLQITDTTYGWGANQAMLGVVTGTPATSPSIPAVPTNAVLLGSVYVTAGATSIPSANITPGVQNAITQGGMVQCTSTSVPSAVRTGQLLWESDVLRVKVASGIKNTDGTPYLYDTNMFIRPVYASGYQNTAQTGLPASTWTNVTLDTWPYDSWSGHVSNAGKWTVPFAGYYLISACLGATGVTGTGNLACDVLVNGVNYAGTVSNAYINSGSTSTQLSCPWQPRILYLNAGDVLTVQGWCSIASWATGTGINSTILTAVLMF